jgi:hypothetical protein
VPDVDKQFDASVDYANGAGHFVRVDVTLQRDSMYPPVDGGGPVAGYVVLSAEEAIALADVLRERAQRIVATSPDVEQRRQP